MEVCVMSDRSGFVRSRWAAIGAAVAVTLGAGAGIGLVSASGSPPSSFVSITPERVLDTRDGVGIGLSGAFVSADGRDLQVTGEVATASVPKVVVPVGATAVSLNVTVVQPTAAGFVSVRPAGAPGAPETSNLNFEAGDITPNAVNVALSAGGAIELTYDAFGTPGPTADLLVDVLGYFVEGEGAPGPQGPQGPEGPRGPEGPAGPGVLHARITTSAGGATINTGTASGVTGVFRNGIGEYTVNFDRAIPMCSRSATLNGYLAGSDRGPGQIIVNQILTLTDPPNSALQVRTYNPVGAPDDGTINDGFDIMVICP
jgi:hypothetical protein